MAEFLSGPTMVLSWAYSGGTVSLAADERSVVWTPSQDYVDVSAGADTQHGRLTALKDAHADLVLVAQAGGTQVVASLAAGSPGTLTIQPEGTAVNKRKIVFPCYADGAVTDMPYAGEVTLTCGFSAAGAVLAGWTDGVN